MLPAIAVKGAEVLAAALIAGVICAAVLAMGMRWLKRRIRRRLERISLTAAGRVAGVAVSAHRAGWWWLWSRPLPDRRWIAALAARRRLWRAVGAAEHAVAQARRTGAPAGDLDGLCRRLRQAAADADRSLGLAGQAAVRGGERVPASSEAAELVSAAGLIQDAAAAAVASVSRPAARNLADDVRREAEALSAGIAAASQAAAGGLPGA